MEKNGSFEGYLSEAAGENQKLEQIVYIDIENLETNPKNFYGLRDVDTLAGLIAVSHLVEPLTVTEKSDGKYMIISGHRRRAAVQKLLDDGVYSERKLPCIIKKRGKIQIEQENGETIEFDEDAVEMLNLIASNRGQREERTVDEKLQEIKYLEQFARAIYNQKNNRQRGRFRNFFAEEILNVSETRLHRIKALEKLTDGVRQAIDENKISETAAQIMTGMTAEEQDACLEKVLSGEIKGTVQEIQNFKSLKNEVVEENISDELPTEENQPESESLSEETPAEKVAESETKLSYPKKFLPTSEKNSVNKIMDVPEEFGDPQKEAEEWFYQERLEFYETICDEAKRLSEEETNELKAAQWAIRASVARYNIEELKLQHKG